MDNSIFFSLMNLGVAGVVLLWFMLRLEKYLGELNATLRSLHESIMRLVNLELNSKGRSHE